MGRWVGVCGSGGWGMGGCVSGWVGECVCVCVCVYV